MANRVNVNITARDLTRGELARMRRNFGALGQDLDRAVGARTRQNFDRLRQSINQSRRDLMSMRGAIPDDEFFRLDRALRQSQRTMQRGFSRVGDRAFARVAAQVRDVTDSFRDLDENARIRVRVDLSALRRADAALRRGLADRDRRVRVRVDPDTSTFGPRLRRTLMAPLRQMGRIAGGILSDGIGQGIVQGFQNSGPVGIAIFAGILASLVAVIGAAIGGILVFAFGGAFVGLASMFAVQSDEIQRNWKTAVENMKDDLSGVGDPLIPVIHEAIHQLEGMVSDFAPHFKQAMEDAAPHLTDFLDELEKGIRNFGEVAFKPMMDAFNVLLDSLGPELRIWLEHLGEAFEYLAEKVTENSDETALAIRLVLELITGLIYALGFLVESWARLVHWMKAAALGFEEISSWFDRNWSISIQMFGADQIAAITLSVMNLWSKVDRNWVRSVLFSAPGLSSVTGLVRLLWDWVNRNWKRTVSFSMLGLNTAISAVRTLWGWVNRNWFRTVTLSVSMPGLDAAKAALGVLGFAKGGVRGISAAATGGARSNMTLVGEQGPEIVNLAPGSHVRSNADSRRIAGQSGGGGGAGASFVFKSSGRRVDDLLLEILREAIHQRGGDPVAVLGG